MEEEAKVEWPFASNIIIPDPIMDWNKPPILDEESIEEIMESIKKEIIIAVSNENKNVEKRFVHTDYLGSVETSLVG